MGPADTLNFLPDPVGRTAKTYFRTTNALIAFICSSFKMNVLSMSSKTDSNLHISAHRHSIHVYMYMSMFQLSSGRHVFFKQIQPKRSLVTWLITLRLIICPSSYKARPDNLIGLSISSQIFVR